VNGTITFDLLRGRNVLKLTGDWVQEGVVSAAPFLLVLKGRLGEGGVAQASSFRHTWQPLLSQRFQPIG